MLTTVEKNVENPKKDASISNHSLLNLFNALLSISLYVWNYIKKKSL